MKVFCTGATGFVGAHTALALLAAGHETRLLVRDQEAARSWFEGRGRHIERFVTVDIRDQTALEQAMAGCDAVFHAAAAVSLDPRRAREMYDTNVCATKAVLGAAARLASAICCTCPASSRCFTRGLTCRRVDTARRPFRGVLAFEARQRSVCSRATAAERAGADHLSGCRHRAGRSQAERRQPRTGVACRADAARSTTGFQCVDVRDLAQAHVWLLEHPADREFEMRATSSAATSTLGTNYAFAWKRSSAGASSVHAYRQD